MPKPARKPVELTGPAPVSYPAVFIGIDPGSSGGLAWISVGTKGESSYRADPMPETLRGILKWFNDARGSQIPRYVMIEKVGGFMASGWGEGKHNMASGHTMFAFGKNVGHLEMALESTMLADVTLEVIPRTWQAALGVAPRKQHKIGRKVIWDESKDDFKRRLKALAQSSFPQKRVTAAVADALLVAEYCRRHHRGELLT